MVNVLRDERWRSGVCFTFVGGGVARGELYLSRSEAHGLASAYTCDPADWPSDGGGHARGGPGALRSRSRARASWRARCGCEACARFAPFSLRVPRLQAHVWLGPHFADLVLSSDPILG